MQPDNIREMNNRRSTGLSDVSATFLHEGGKRFKGESLGLRIKRLRKEKRLTQVQVATLVIGQTSAQPSVSRWENDEDTPNPVYMEKLAELFGVTEAELHYGPDADLHPSQPSTQIVPLVGFVGAGDQVFPIDDHPLGHGLEEIELPFTVGNRNRVAVKVRGDSQRPMLRDGWVLSYSRDWEGVPDHCVGQLCVVKVSEDGPTLIKEVRRGYSRGRFNLLSTNAQPIEDVALDWAAPIDIILPR